MTAISSVSSRPLAVVPIWPERRPDDALIASDGVMPQAAVSSSPAGLASLQPPLLNALSWKTRSSDALTSLMTVNFGASTLLDRLQGLGAAALQRFGSEAGDFSQAVSRLNSGGGQSAYQVALKIRLADGVDVSVGMDSKGDSLALQIKSSGQLSAADRHAVTGMATAFQNAIDGMTRSSGLDFSGLLDLDPALVASIDLQTKYTFQGREVQSQEFHADQSARSFSSVGQDGSIKLGIDLRQLAAMGNARQRQTGVQAYLKQFDEAGVRGHAHAATLASFKDAFSQMIGASSTTAADQRATPLSEDDLALLSGVPDFSASISDTPVSSNPMRLEETDTFSYRVEQGTSISAHGQGNRAISQRRHAHLEASFHESLRAGMPLALDNSRQSQNYAYKRVSEDAVSDTEIRHDNGLMTSAATGQTVSRSTQEWKYLMGVLTGQTTTPETSTVKRDLLKELLPKGARAARAAL
ncbi:hypothetical protein [Duganella callida]|uniref:Lactate dehydrogenase n=1 Tax=Duganella callida TaxID=2561932 RepID=A0A4Y9S2G4_9BURK|nr:hypothetical protein [Duganella callida]TFW15669.1 hypothetical protein E4L98_25905 [Duganella callida]